MICIASSEELYKQYQIEPLISLGRKSRNEVALLRLVLLPLSVKNAIVLFSLVANSEIVKNASCCQYGICFAYLLLCGSLTEITTNER